MPPVSCLLSPVSCSLKAMALQGDLGDFPLTDIIQLLDLSKKTGAVFIQGQRGQQQLDGWL